MDGWVPTFYAAAWHRVQHLLVKIMSCFFYGQLSAWGSLSRSVTSAVCGVSNPGSHLPSSASSCLRLLNHCGDHSPGTAPRNLQMMDSNSFHRQSHCSCRRDRILQTSAPAVESRNLAPELLRIAIFPSLFHRPKPTACRTAPCRGIGRNATLSCARSSLVQQ